MEFTGLLQEASPISKTAASLCLQLCQTVTSPVGGQKERLDGAERCGCLGPAEPLLGWEQSAQSCSGLILQPLPAAWVSSSGLGPGCQMVSARVELWKQNLVVAGWSDPGSRFLFHMLHPSWQLTTAFLLRGFDNGALSWIRERGNVLGEEKCHAIPQRCVTHITTGFLAFGCRKSHPLWLRHTTGQAWP